MFKTHEITSEVVQPRYAQYLKDWVGKTRKMTVCKAAELSGVKKRTLESYRNEGVMPPFDVMLRLWSVVDEPRFVNDCLEMAGFTGAHRIEGGEVCPIGVGADISKFLSELLERVRDGEFCHVDRAEMRPLLREVIGALTALQKDWGKK